MAFLSKLFGKKDKDERQEQEEIELDTLFDENEDDDGEGLTEEEIATLQEAIDKLEASLPAMHEFIIPGGTEAAARANLCRTVCRRAEREIVSLQRECEVPQNILVYINRLSDYLFLLQRQLIDGNEKKWEKPCK